MMKTMKRVLARFARNEDGVLIAEVAVIVPLLIWAFLAMFVYWDAYKTQNTMTKASYTIADMITRRLDPVDDGYITGLKTVFDYIMNDDQTSSMAVASVKWNEAQSRYEVLWSEARGTAFSPLSNGDLANMKEDMPLMTDGDTVIVLQTRVHFVPPFFEPSFWLTVGESDFDSFIVTRPRRATSVDWTS